MVRTRSLAALTFAEGSATADVVFCTLQDDFKERTQEVLVTVLVDGSSTLGAAGRAVETITGDD